MAKQIYSGPQQSLLERTSGREKRALGAGGRGRGGADKSIVNREGGCCQKKKKSPSTLGSVGKKSKETSASLMVAAWLHVLFSHTLKSSSRRAAAAD